MADLDKVIEAFNRLMHTESVNLHDPIIGEGDVYPISEEDYAILKPYMDCWRTVTYKKTPNGSETILDSRTASHTWYLINHQRYLAFGCWNHPDEWKINLRELIQSEINLVEVSEV